MFRRNHASKWNDKSFDCRINVDNRSTAHLAAENGAGCEHCPTRHGYHAHVIATAARLIPAASRKKSRSRYIARSRLQCNVSPRMSIYCSRELFWRSSIRRSLHITRVISDRGIRLQNALVRPFQGGDSFLVLVSCP